MFVVILFLIFSYSTAKNVCPDLKPVKNFDFFSYGAETWYEIGRYRNTLEYGDCVVMNTLVMGRGFIVQFSEVDRRTMMVYDGMLFQQKQDLGVLKYIFEDYEVTSNVITINYTSYAVVYNCWYNETTDQVIEQGWMLSRTKDVDHKIKDKMIGILKDLNVVNTDRIFWDDFSPKSCSYDNLRYINTTLADSLMHIESK